MASPAQRLAALRRLAEDTGATDAEKENAKRRIAEHEEKYGAAPNRGHSFDADFLRDTLDDFFRNVASQDARDVSNHHAQYAEQRWWKVKFSTEYEPPFHYDARCWTEPVEEAPPGGGQKFIWEFARWCVNREPGPFGRVEKVETSHNPEARATVFTWRCPVCGRATTISISDDVMQYAGFEKEAKKKLEEELFTRFNGNSDNRCARCCRHRGIG